jgi:ferredoxin
VKFKIIYSHEIVEAPILSTVILETGVPINILEAKITPSEGEMIVDIPVSGEDLARVLEALRKHGIEVREVGPTIEINKEKCVMCGACISPCPTGAITMVGDELRVDDKLCIRCKACVYACPVRALTMASEGVT